MQDEATRTIVGALRVRLTAGEEARRGNRSKVLPEAYDLLVRASQNILQSGRRRCKKHMQCCSEQSNSLRAQRSLMQAYPLFIQLNMPNLASLYGPTGRHDDARQLWRELMEIKPNFSVGHLKSILPYQDPASFDWFVDGIREAGVVP